MSAETIWLAKTSLYFERRLEILSGSGGPAYDLTGYDVRAQVRATPESSSAIVDFTSTIGAPATDGVVTLSLSTAQTALLTPGRYVFSVVLDPPSLESFELMNGTFEVRYSVTR